MAKIAKIYLVACWSFFIFKLLTLPMPGGLDYGSSYYDKTVHLFLFGMLSYLLFITAREFLEKQKWLALILGMGLSIIYAASLEYYQLFIPGRYPSSLDLVAASVGIVLAAIIVSRKKPKLLLHVCCIGCGAYISQELRKKYKVTLFFYNPNIYPESEYKKRLEEAEKTARQLNLKLITGEYDHSAWLKLISGLEEEPERGKRCSLCYEERMKRTACLAREKKHQYFTTTLTISPHKDAQAISRIGARLGGKYDIKFLDKDFKKQDGFKKSVELARKLGLYRQDYCGCEFSKN